MNLKILIFILTVWISLISCKKSNENSDSNQNDFNTHILDGYFVRSIAFDSNGNAWIGTFKQGLIKYNSNETIVYNSENSILSDTSVIYDIAIDSENNVWIACEGLIKFDGVDFTHFNSSNSPIPEDFVQSIAIDSKDNVWFTSCRFRQGGVVKYDGSDWTVFTPENSDLPVNLVKSITIDNNDNVWLALNEIVNNAYLVKISHENWTIYTSNELGFKPYYFGNIEINSQNEICGAIDYMLSSLIINNGPQVFLFDGNSTEQLQFDSTTNIGVMSVDNQDNIWCAVHRGYALFDGQKWIVKDSIFENNSIFAIEQSNDNTMWFGTGDGIYISD